MIAAPFYLLFLWSMAQQQNGAAALPSSADPARAVAVLQETIRRNPDVESNYTDLGHVLLRTQNFQEAVLVLETARARFPKSAQAALSAGVAYYGLRRFPDAVAAMLTAGHLDRDAEQPIAFLHRFPENWGDRKDEIVALFTEFAKRHPRNSLGHLALGRATGDLAELQRSAQLDPRRAETHAEIGSLLEAKREFPAAIAAFRRAAELNPADPVPHYRLSRLYARTGDQARAQAERERHEKLAAREKAELDRRQAATKHLDLKVRQ